MDEYLIASAVLAAIMLIGVIVMVMRALPPRVSTDRHAVKRAEGIIHERTASAKPSFIGPIGEEARAAALSLSKREAASSADAEPETVSLAHRTLPVAYVTLREASFPQVSQIIDFARERYPDLGEIAVSEQTLPTEGTVVSVGDSLFEITMLEAPLPWRQLRDACGNARWWPDATREMKHHVAAIRIEVVGEAKSKERISNIVSLTAVAAAAAEIGRGSGFYWPAAGIVHPTQTLLSLVDSIATGRIPLQLWIDLKDFTAPDGGQGVYTTGLMLFIDRELETEPSEEMNLTDARSVVRDVIRYVLENEIVPGHGSTLTVGSGTRLFVRHGMSRSEAQVPVISVEAR